MLEWAGGKGRAGSGPARLEGLGRCLRRGHEKYNARECVQHDLRRVTDHLPA